MRPPVLPSGNPPRWSAPGTPPRGRFNEAAGFTQRKRRDVDRILGAEQMKLQ